MNEIAGYDRDEFFSLPIQMQLMIIECDARRRTRDALIDSYHQKMKEYKAMPWFIRIFKSSPKLYL